MATMQTDCHSLSEIATTFTENPCPISTVEMLYYL